MKDTGIFLEDKEFYNVEEVAQLFSVRWIEFDMVETFRPTRKHLITTKSIRKFIIEGTKGV